MTDVELLEQHRHGNDQAFAQLVRSHLGWVYGVARRRMRDVHLAEDVAQAVFVLLHRKMPHFPADGAMMNWLHRAAWFAADVAVRNQQRRRHRETEAAMLQSDASSQPADEWAELAPLLDELVGKLSHTDREAVLLRYYRDMTFAQVGQQIGSTEEAARKRVDRAIEKLRQMAGKRGVPISASALSVGLLSQIATAPPSGLVATTTTIATAQSGSALAASLTPILKGASFMMASTKLMITGVVAAAILLGSGTVWLATKSTSDTSVAFVQPATQPTIDSPLWRDAYPKLAPFTDIRWNNTMAQVKVEGTWYEWIAIDGQQLPDIIQFTQTLERKDWQKRIAEDLVEVLARMGHQSGNTVSMQLRPLSAEAVAVGEEDDKRLAEIRDLQARRDQMPVNDAQYAAIQTELLNKSVDLKSRYDTKKQELDRQQAIAPIDPIILPRVPMTQENRQLVWQKGLANSPVPLPAPILAKIAIPKLAPYSAIRWRDQMPEIQVNGTWYEWLGLNDMTIQQVITTAQQRLC